MEKSAGGPSSSSGKLRNVSGCALSPVRKRGTGSGEGDELVAAMDNPNHPEGGKLICHLMRF
jgi:hypothetical protein